MEITEEKIAIENLEICSKRIDEILKGIEERKNYEKISNQIFNLRKLLRISESNLRHVYVYKHILESIENRSY